MESSWQSGAERRILRRAAGQNAGGERKIRPAVDPLLTGHGLGRGAYRMRTAWNRERLAPRGRWLYLCVYRPRETKWTRGQGKPLLAETQIVTEQEIEAKVIEIVAEKMGADKNQITRTTSFVEDLNADSLDTVELVMEFEDVFETSIPDEQAEKIKTVGQAIDYIKTAVNGAGNA